MNPVATVDSDKRYKANGQTVRGRHIVRRVSGRVRSGLLIHGRHLQARGWEEMMWGDPGANKLGTLPTAVLAMMDEGSERIALIIIGSGGSWNENRLGEAEVAQRLFLSRFEELGRYPAIAEHPAWHDSKAAIRALIATAVVDTATKNTAEEIARAASTFADRGISRVLHVTSASHGPRCQQLQSVARAAGVIPAGQRWVLVTDDVPYPGTAASDTLVIEEPHRGDDPLLFLPPELRPTSLFRQFYTLTAEQRAVFLRDIAAVLKRLR